MTKNNHTIKFTSKAFEDLDEIYSYISHELSNEVAADNILGNIETSIMRLANFSFSCSFVTDKLLKDKGYRRLVIENYIVFYLVREREEQVIIMRVLNGRQKYQGLI